MMLCRHGLLCLQAVANWPPAHAGDKAITTKWWATARGGALFLAQQPATSNNKFVPMVTIPLPGCDIDVPTEGLRGKTKCAHCCCCCCTSLCVSRPILHMPDV